MRAKSDILKGTHDHIKWLSMDKTNPVVAVNMFSWKVAAVLSVEIWAIFVCRGEASLSLWCS